MKFTPYDIVMSGETFSIPIYQRLFEWDKPNIENLLDDLKKTFEKTNGNGDYHIGMLTSTEEKELVDGQQRFTVMMLLGAVLQHDFFFQGWKDFLIFNGEPRLHFSSRPNDNADLWKLINNTKKDPESDLCKSISNKKLSRGFMVISEYVNNRKNVPENKRQDFASYIFHHMCFFISTLPKGYSPRDLNKYFERMNTSGKNLELHEILKVKLLSNLPKYVSSYMSLWNRLADVDTLLIRRRKNESENDLNRRKREALNANIRTIIANNLINGVGTEEGDDSISIKDITPSQDEPKSERENNKNSRCALTFPFLLLHSLYRLHSGNIEDNIEDFFRPPNLLTIFNKYLPYEGDFVNPERIQDFMELLVKGRLALDVCFIRPTEFGYSLDMTLAEDDEDLHKLMMFQSMIYVSSSNYTNYKWFGWLMDSIQQSGGIPDASFMYNFLKERDDAEHPVPSYESLSYGEIRYWFWRLDFYLWLNRKTIFNDEPKSLAVANNYVFRRNRNIEHIAPQTPDSLSDMKWEDIDGDRSLMNSFGNLVMISQGLNSALSNESYEVKKEHVRAYCNGSLSGSIESLKLLVVHDQYDKWDKQTIVDHGHKMYDLLKSSFCD